MPYDEPANPIESLKTAEAEFAEAERRLKEAEREFNAAEAKLALAIEAIADHSEFPVKVIYNGLVKPFTVSREEHVERLLDQARQAFGPIPDAHRLSLFTLAGVELNDKQTISAAGIKPCEELLLRASAVKGG